jgi:hypothetical protein
MPQGQAVDVGMRGLMPRFWQMGHSLGPCPVIDVVSDVADGLGAGLLPGGALAGEESDADVVGGVVVEGDDGAGDGFKGDVLNVVADAGGVDAEDVGEILRFSMPK